MINTQSIRRPMLALIAGSALLLGGAAMPKFCLQNPTMLYVIGEARMALGDHDGGLRMIGSAAERNDTASAPVAEKTSVMPAAQKQAAPTMCKKQDAPKSSDVVKNTKSVAFIYHGESPREPKYVELAKLENVDFASLRFDHAKFEQKMRRAQEYRGAEAAEQARRTVIQVREELERRGIAVTPAMIAPPVPPTVHQ
jgi:hypothetical protein